MLGQVVVQVVQVAGQFLVHSQDYLAGPQVRFQVDLQVSIRDQLAFALFEAADAGQLALFLCRLRLRPALDTRAHLPMIVLRAILILEVIKEPRLE